MTRKDKVKEIIEVASQIRMAIDEIEHLMDKEVIEWAKEAQYTGDQWPDEWAREILSLGESIQNYAKHIPNSSEI